MSDSTRNWLIFLARFFMGGMFIVVAVRKWVGFAGSTKFVASMGVPMPEILLALAIALELIAGAMLILGYRTRLASIGLIIYVIILTPIFHGPWHFQMPRAMNELDQCMKNLNLIGCMLLFIVFGAGRISLDAGSGRDRPLQPAAT